MSIPCYVSFDDNCEKVVRNFVGFDDNCHKVVQAFNSSWPEYNLSSYLFYYLSMN